MVIEQILMKYENVFDSILSKTIWNKEDREDAKQEMAIFLLEKASQYDASRSGVNTFVSVCINKFVTTMRRNNAINKTAWERALPKLYTEEAVEDLSYHRIESRTIVERASERLSERSKKVLFLLWDGLSPVQISKELDVSLATVYQMIKKHLEPAIHGALL